MKNQRLAELMSRKLSGEATAAELQELYNLLQSNPGDQYFSEILLTYWNHRSDQDYLGDNSADQHFAHILQMAGETQPEQDIQVIPFPAQWDPKLGIHVT